jgi:ABC-type nitrate/sulfonate/bicarbonate transport system substrate-binding protein
VRAIVPAGRPDFSLYGSNMSNSDGVTDTGEISPRGRNKRGSALLVLAAGLLLFAAVVGTAFYWLRPTTLRIAVGPSGSSDLQLIQGLAQNFAQEGNTVRLTVVQTAGPVDSIKVLAAGDADLAVARTDEGMPDGTE